MSNDPVEALFERAERNGITMATICARANVAQSTPSRWRTEKNGANYGTVRKLNEALEALICERDGTHTAHDTIGSGDRSPGKSYDRTADQRSEAA